MFIVFNCIIHRYGDTPDLQEARFDLNEISMMLPPYHPNYNPTKFVFDNLLVKMKSERARYVALSNNEFE